MKKQLIMTLLIAFLLLFVLVYTVLFIGMQSIVVQRESENIHNQAELSKSLLDTSVASIPSFTRAWAGREETYDYLQGNGSGFLEENISRETFLLYQLNFLVILNAKNELVYEQFYDYHDDDSLPVPPGMLPLYSEVGAQNLASFDEVQDKLPSDRVVGVEGFVRHNRVLYYVSAYPALHADETGPAMGSVIFGRIMDGQVFSALEADNQLDFTLEAMEQLPLSEGKQLQLAETGALVEINNIDVRAYRTVQDVFGAPSLVISAVNERALFWRGNIFLTGMLVLIAAGCVVILGFVACILNRRIGWPLSRMINGLKGVEKDSASLPVLPSNNQITELNSVTERVNAMLLRMGNDRELIRKNSETLYYNSNFDLLTGLRNRGSIARAVEETLVRAREQCDHVTVFFMDLDRFKNVNDTLGHSVGDLLIKAVGQRMKNRMGSEMLIARMGGDEFVVCVENMGEDADRQAYADMIFHLFSTPFCVRDRELPMSASVGAARYPEDGQDADTLIKNAELAMFEAKTAGEGLFVTYQGAFQVALQQKIRLENRLRSAVNEGCCDFCAYLQPKVIVETGEIVSCEALMRWISPNGVVSPGDFIPQAESSGLIIPLSWWMIRECCRISRQLDDLGISQTISINVSAQVLMHENFLSVLTDAVAEFGVDIQHIDIEITETTLLDDIERAGMVLGVLDDIGAEISVDDFGTGYSSLSYLNKLSIDRIKIDQSFVAGISKDENDKVIIRAILAMAKSLGMVATAEGVETPEQYAFLRDENCEEIQGYMVSRPLPVDDYIEFFRRSNAYFDCEC